MDKLNFDKINNLTYVQRIVQISDYDYILYIDLNRTSQNIKELINKYQSEFTNLIKINIKCTNKYKIIDDNNNYKIKMFKEINLTNKLIKINLEYSEKYLNFYIKDLIIYKQQEQKKDNIHKHNKTNANKNYIVNKIINLS